MSSAYPAALPRPQRAGYAISVAPSAVSTARDTSLPRCRQIGRGSRTDIDLAWQFTDAQFATFATWWRTDLRGGSLPATIALPNGAADAPAAVQFTGPYSATDLVGRWRVTAQVRLLAPPRLTAADLAGLDLAGFNLPASALHDYIHHLYPAWILP